MRQGRAGILVRIAAVATAVALPASAADQKTVLTLYAESRLVPVVAILDDAIRSSLQSRSGSPIDFYTEYLDLSWFGGNGGDALTARLLKEKYAGRRIDVVIPCGEAAIDFVLRERDALFPGAAVVFNTAMRESIDASKLPRDVTGVTMLLDWADAVELVLRLHPGTSRIAFVGGAGPSARKWEENARRAFERFAGRVEFTYLTGLPMSDLMSAASTLPDGTAALFNSFLRDGKGRTFTTPEALALFAGATRIPIYSVSETLIGHGIVGGPMVDFAAQGAAAAQLADRILRGEHLGPKDIVRQENNRYVFDARELERFGIDDARLPPGSVVQLRKPSVWSSYRWQILGAAALIALQGLLIGGLLLQRNRRRRAEVRVGERLRFETLLSDLAAAFIDVRPEQLDRQIEDGLRRVGEALDLDRASIGEAMAGALRVTHSWRRKDVAPFPALFQTSGTPWIEERLRGGHVVSWSRAEELPEEAAADRATIRALGVRSLVLLPFLVETNVGAVLACSLLRDERQWDEEVVARLRVLAKIFAIVLSRRRAQAEVERGREDLAHALRVATLGELTATLAHEVNQPLAGILNNAQALNRMLLNADGLEREELAAALRDIGQDARRASEVVRRLHALFRKDSDGRKPVDVNEAIVDVMGLLGKELERRRVALLLHLDRKLPPVLGDVVQLQQVVMNVVVNACDAMTGTDDRARELRIETAPAGPGRIAIAFRDSGKGVADDELARIFERFITTKPDGLGMGLSISRSIIEAHGGRIWATRNEDRGLTIHGELPCLPS